MKSFIGFITEEKMRQGLSHFRDLKPHEIHSLIHRGKISGDFTEKTDGLAFAVGHDKDGFYTKSARSDKVRNSGEYTNWGKKKFGEDHVSPFAHHYDELHKTLQENPRLQSHLKDLHHKSGGNDVMMKGEVFWKGLGTPSEKGMKFVGTHYDPSKMGKKGSFILHSKLPENHIHSSEKIKDLSNEDMKFDHDKVPNSKVHIDVSDELQHFNTLNHEKMTSRKSADAEEKEHNKKKFESIKKSLESKLREHINTNLKPKFGSETEGHVFHPEGGHSPKFKLTSDSFAKFKSEQKGNKND